MKITPPNYFQCPNDLVDHWLPLLGEAEIKVLLLIIRKTFGWHKQRDRISLSQMQEFTGLNRTNASKAIQSLTDKGIVLKEIEGILGTEKVYYSLIIQELNTGTETVLPQYQNSTPPSTGTVPTKETYTKDTQKNKQTSDCVEPVVSSSFKLQEEALEAVGLNSDSIKTILTLIPSIESIQMAVACSVSQKPDDLGAFLYKAIKNGWKPPKISKSEAPSNKQWAVDLSLKIIDKMPKGTYFEALSNYVEIGYVAAQCKPSCIPYEETSFKELVFSELEKKGLKIDVDTKMSQV